MRASFCFILILVLLLANVQQAHSLESPFSASLSISANPISANSISANNDAELNVFVRHLEGQDYITLKRVRPATEPSYSLDGRELQAPLRPLLYRGKLKRSGRNGEHSASASIIAGKFKVTFHGRRRGRLIAVSRKLQTRSKAARTSFVASFSTFKCGVESPSVNSYYSRNLFALAPALLQSRQLSISADADYEYYAKFGSRTFAEIEDIFNTVNSIYLKQLGIEVVTNEIKAYSKAAQPYNELIGENLLREFRAYNNANNRLKSADAYHLFTGKTLEPIGMVGLSYVGAICQEGGRYSYGMTAYYPSEVQPIITAHEIAHGLGATHTGEGIMLANLSSNPRNFSVYSISEILSYVNQYGTCLSIMPPTIDLKRLSYSKNGLFRLTLVPGSGLSDACQMGLYASNKRAYLSSAKIFRKARRIFFSEASSMAGGKKLEARVRGNIKKARRIYLRAVVICGASKGYSKISSTLIRSRSVRAFFTALSEAFGS